jgi:hypothetical protein
MSDLDKEKRKKERLEHFRKSLIDFQRTGLESLKTNLIVKFELEEFQVNCFENSAELINNCYWSLVDIHVRPSIAESKNDDERIDIYKILSCIEYSIINQKPFIVTKKDNEILDYNSESDQYYVIAESIINGTFAFECAFYFIKSWQKILSELFNSEVHTNMLFYYLEPIAERTTSMKILEEHIYVLSFSTSVSNYPVFTNATWWRSICLNLFLLKETNYNLKF